MYGDHPAVTLVYPHGEQRVTYREFFMQAAHYAAALEAVGVRPKDLVISVLQHGESVLYSFWGALLLGAVPSIFPFLTDKLDRDRYFSSIRQLVELSGVRVVITHDELEASLQEHLRDLPSLAGIVNTSSLTARQVMPRSISTATCQPQTILPSCSIRPAAPACKRA